MTPWSDDAGFADKLGKTVLAAYENLPQRGKPQGNEWTVLAAVVLARQHATHTAGYGLQVLVLATGNKCLGESQLCEKGTVVNDCHAEILARRGLKKLLWDDLGLLARKEKSRVPAVLDSRSFKPNGMGCMVPGDSLHLYISETPCGDASIVIESPSDHTSSGKDAIVRLTGARLLGKRKELHAAPELGCLRTKSGRCDLQPGKRTTSMSCSDKILSWCFGGIQGGLLSHFVTPIYLSSVVVGTSAQSGNDCNQAALNSLRRSIIERANAVIKSKSTGDKMTNHRSFGVPRVYVCNVKFAATRPKLTSRQRLKRPSKEKPSPACGYALLSIWPGQKSCEFSEVLVASRGIRQGASKKSVPCKLPRKIWSSVCKYIFFENFLAIRSSVENRCPPELITYAEIKAAATSYVRDKVYFFEHHAYNTWLRMPRSYLNFVLCDTETDAKNVHE